MTATATRTLICDLIAAIAPEADTAALPDRADMRRALDLDSIDFTNLIIAIHQRTGIDIPETDYHLLFTMAGAVNYLERRGAGKA
jgi:acyl carrier protein